MKAALSSSVVRPLAGALAFLAAVGAGWLAAEHRATLEVSIPGGTAPRNSSSAVTAHHRGAPPEVKTLMARIRKAGSAQERMQATVELAEAIPEGDLGTWLKSQWFDLDDGPEKTIFTGILKERWLQSDPASMVGWCVDSGERSMVENLTSWGAKDPEAVMAFLEKRPGATFAEREFLKALAATHPDEAKSYLKGLIGRKGGTGDMAPPSQMLKTLAAHDLKGYQELAESFPPSWHPYAACFFWTGKLENSFEDSIGQLAADPQGANLSEIIGQSPDLIRKMLDRIDTLPENLRSQMGYCLLFMPPGELAGLSDATLKSVGKDEEQIRQFRIDSMPKLAAENPDRAEQLMDSLGLTGEQRQQCLKSIVGAYACNGEKAAELIARLPTEEDRRAAQEEWERLQIPKLPCSNLPEWLDLAKAGGKANPWDSRAQLMRMDGAQLDAFRGAFAAMTGEDRLNAAMYLVPLQPASTGKVLPLQGDAVAELIRNADTADSQGYPLERRATLAAVHADDMAREDPAAGAAWVAGLPDGREKTYAQGRFYKTWKDYNPAAAETWLDGLSPEAREAVAPFIGN